MKKFLSFCITFLFFYAVLLESSDLIMQTRIEANPMVDQSARVALRECKNLMPDDHPAREQLDRLYERVPRPSYSLKEMRESGFTHIRMRHRGVTFAEHPLLPDYFFKAACDKDSDAYFRSINFFLTDKWAVGEFTGRIKKRNAISRTVQNLGMTSIIVPQKWLYLFPENSIPETSRGVQPKSTMVVAEKMDLLPYDQNLLLWKEMPEEDQKDLFILVMMHQLHDPAPGNIWYTTDGRLAFIDTKAWSPRITRPDLPLNWFGPLAQNRWKKLRKYGLPKRWRGLPRKWKG